MFKKIILPMALVATVSLGACEGFQGSGTKERIGTVAGAVGGGVLGAQIGGGKGQMIATGLGTLLGAWVGNEIGTSLDKADYAYAREAEQRAYTAPIGQQISWNNPESGNYGTVTPVRQGTTTAGNECREYEQTIYVGGRAETGVGVACKMSDGRWEVQS
jgi:surface antigen